MPVGVQHMHVLAARKDRTHVVHTHVVRTHVVRTYLNTKKCLINTLYISTPHYLLLLGFRLRTHAPPTQQLQQMHHFQHQHVLPTQQPHHTAPNNNTYCIAFEVTYH